MRGLLMALVLLFATASAFAKDSRTAPGELFKNAHFSLNNDGKTEWVPDANGGRAYRKHRKKTSNLSAKIIDPNGNAGSSCIVRSKKTGASARVGCSHVAAFQAYVDDLEANGASVYTLGGIRKGGCSSGSQHPCGSALDVCQLRRGVVSPRCHLPGRQAIAAIASRNGLFEGGQWCNSDYGHAQVGGSDCSTRMASARRKQRHAMSVTP